MDFSNRSPLELMSLGDRERVHTALLSWILGQDSPLAADTRGRIAARLAGLPAPVTTSTTSSTEVKDLDVLVLLEGPAGPWRLAVEAKLKSREHSDQLTRYDQVLASGGSRTEKVFLTLAGDDPTGGTGWRSVSYADLASTITAEFGVDAGSSNHYVKDFVAMIERLTEAVKTSMLEEGAAVLFDKTSHDPSGHPGFVDFVERLRLRKILQQVWMTCLAEMVTADGQQPMPVGWYTEIDETHGEAILNFQNSAIHAGYCIGLQVQHGALKMFCYPWSPVMATSASARPSPAEISRAAEILVGMCAAVGVTVSPTKTRSGGFTSVRLAKAPTGRDLTSWSHAVVESLRVTLAAADHDHGST